MSGVHESLFIRWIPALSESGAEVASPPFRIVLDQRVLREVQKRIVTGGESLGLLLGEVEGEVAKGSAYVLADRYLPSVDAIAEDADAEEAGRVLRPLLEAASLAGKVVAGWYRAHAALGPALSAAEERLHRRWFPEPWQFACVGLADPARPGGGVFSRTEPDTLAPVPFHELLESSALLPDGRKATSLTWRNYRTTDAVVRPGEPTDVAPPPAREPPPAEKPAPAGEPARRAPQGPPAGDPGTGSPPEEHPFEFAQPTGPAGSAPPSGPGRSAERPAASAEPPSPPGRRSPPQRRSPPERRPPPAVRRRGDPSSAPARLVLPDPLPSERPGGRRRLAGLVAVLLLAAAGWAAWEWLVPGEGGTAASPEASDPIEFAEPAGAEDEGTSEGSGEEPADARSEDAAPPAESRGTALGTLADRVFDAVEAYRGTRRDFNRGTADCRGLQADHERTAEAFRALSERFVTLRDRAGPAAEAEYRRAAAGADEVARHLAASGCPPPS